MSKHLPDPLRRAATKVARRRRSRGTWAEYEHRKRAWIAAHPAATSEEYERAMRSITEELRL